MLISPRLVAIDSSILGTWAKDSSSVNPKIRAKANAALNSLLESGWLPLLCWHHFEELAKHADIQVVTRRIAFLKSFPHVAWIANNVGPYHLGSIVDVFDAEVKAIVESKEITLSELLCQVRESLVRYGSPLEVSQFGDWRDFHPLFQAKARREREIASFMHTQMGTNDQVLFVETLENLVVDDRILGRLLTNQTAEIAQELRVRGDTRISDPMRSAAEFSHDVASNVNEIRNSGGNLVDAFAKQHDVLRGDIFETTTVAEFKRLSVLRSLVRASAKRLKLDIEEVWPTLRDAEIPSEVVKAVIREARKTAPRASGSDLTDDYLACLAPYVDAVVVDKRTNEFITQGRRRNPSFSNIMGVVVRAASYEQLTTALASHAAR